MERTPRESAASGMTFMLPSPRRRPIRWPLEWCPRNPLARGAGRGGEPLRGTVASARCRRRKPHSRGSLGVPRAGCDSACSAEGLPASPGALSTSFRDRTLARWLAGGRLLARARHLSNPLFLETRRFPGQLAEVVELGAPDCGPLDHLDLVDPRRVQREGALHPHSIRDAPDREGCPGAPTALPDDHPLEGLKPLLFALDDLHPHPHGVPGSEAPPVLLELSCVHDADRFHRPGSLLAELPIWGDSRARGPV